LFSSAASLFYGHTHSLMHTNVPVSCWPTRTSWLSQPTLTLARFIRRSPAHSPTCVHARAHTHTRARPQFCSPTRCALQSGRLPTHVNVVNADMAIYNPKDPISGFAGIPRNMTGMAEHMKAGGYATHQTGKWDAGMATPDHTPQGRGYDTSLGYFHHANGVFERLGILTITVLCEEHTSSWHQSCFVFLLSPSF
jgi:hypothetical protein